MFVKNWKLVVGGLALLGSIALNGVSCSKISNLRQEVRRGEDNYHATVRRHAKEKAAAIKEETDQLSEANAALAECRKEKDVLTPEPKVTPVSPDEPKKIARSSSNGSSFRPNGI